MEAIKNPIQYADIQWHKSSEFLRGQRDCKDGNGHKSNQSAEYNRGYSAQYQHEQNMEYITRGH